jgi:hypothetical protein
VVNEAADPLRAGMDNPMTALVRHRGVEAYTRTPFELARAANPEATLLINDYRTDAAYEKVIQQLRAGDHPRSIRSSGSRATCTTACGRGQDLVVLRALRPLRRAAHFTETRWSAARARANAGVPPPPNSSKPQARQVVEFYTLLFSTTPRSRRSPGGTSPTPTRGRAPPAGLLRRDLSRKPAFTALHDWSGTNGGPAPTPPPALTAPPASPRVLRHPPA